MYSTNSPTSTTASIGMIECLSGSVSEYSVAAARNATSTECGRVSWIPKGSRRVAAGASPLPAAVAARVRRVRYHAMNTTLLQPRPISRRFAPVMLASAKEHGEARPGSPLGQAITTSR